jgi:hypothetical protein
MKQLSCVWDLSGSMTIRSLFVPVLSINGIELSFPTAWSHETVGEFSDYMESRDCD